MKKKHKKVVRVLSWVAFILYFIAMVYFLFFSEQLGRHPGVMYRYSLEPFREIRRYLYYHHKIGGTHVLLNLAGNVICFMPFGFVLPLLSDRQRSLVRVTVISLLCSSLVELIQLVSKVGSCDVDDMNTLGGFLGYVFFAICYQIWRWNRYGKEAVGYGTQAQERK